MPGGACRGGSGGAGCGSASPLPAAEGGEHRAEGRQVFVVRGPLLVVHHEQPLGAGAERVGHAADRLAHLLLPHIVAPTVALGFVGKHSGGATTGARLGRGSGTRAALAHEQPAVRTAHGLGWPARLHLPLDQQVAVWAISVPGLGLLRGGRRSHGWGKAEVPPPCLVVAGTGPPQTSI